MDVHQPPKAAGKQSVLPAVHRNAHEGFTKKCNTTTYLSAVSWGVF